MCIGREGVPENLEGLLIKVEQLCRWLVQALLHFCRLLQTTRRQHDGLHSSVRREHLAFHEAAFLEPVDEPRHRRRVARKALRERAHRHRFAGGKQHKHLEVPGGESDFREFGRSPAELFLEHLTEEVPYLRREGIFGCGYSAHATIITRYPCDSPIVEFFRNLTNSKYICKDTRHERTSDHR